MEVESLAYEFQPKGYENSRDKKDYSGGSWSGLEISFLKWLNDLASDENFPYDRDSIDDEMEDFYDLALQDTENLEFTQEDVPKLISTFKDHEAISYSGIFLSVLYNRLPDKKIVYDSDIPVDYLLQIFYNRVGKEKAGLTHPDEVPASRYTPLSRSNLMVTPPYASQQALLESHLLNPLPEDDKPPCLVCGAVHPDCAGCGNDGDCGGEYLQDGLCPDCREVASPIGD